MDESFIKQEVLRILLVFNEYCKKYNIKYVLGYGTLLGAIRHKGFIPWDDDIDVVLTTNEYHKLRNSAKNNHYLDEQKRYRFAIPGDKDYCYSFIKVIDEKYVVEEKNIAPQYNIGLYIDVFRVDYWPESKIQETIKLKYARSLLNLNKICIKGNITDSKLQKLNKFLIPVDLIYKALGIRTEKLVSRLERVGLNNKTSKYMGNMMSGSGWKTEKLPVEVFQGITMVSFEGYSFPAPAKFDTYLSTIYGDYMKLPSKDKQVSHGYNIIEIKSYE